MVDLKQASDELFSRSPDECCESLHEMAERCRARKQASKDIWESPKSVSVHGNDTLQLQAGKDIFRLNNWSFSQVCKMAGVAKDTVNRLTPDTASRVLQETLPRNGTKPLQVFLEDDVVRSVHGTQYTRLYDLEVVNLLRDFAVDFQPPQKGFNNATGLYLGEEDMFAFLIDPLGWTEIEGETFAPGFFIWNSEVGRRSLGITTFWFQAVCANHIVWDATNVEDFSRKHTASVRDGLTDIRRIIEGLVAKRDERKDGFARVIQKAMETSLGTDADEALKSLLKQGIGRSLAKAAIQSAARDGRFTLFAVIDALTRMSGQIQNAGDRTEADQKAGQLLELVGV